MSLSKKLRASIPTNATQLQQSRSNQALPELKISRSLSTKKSKDQFERLSGVYDYSISGGVFSDPSIVTHPSSRCVRCSNHASMCMPCTEYLCDESLTFYRKMRARGAISLFQNAVTEAGLGRLLKFTLFRIWKNGCTKRVLTHNKKKYIVEKLFGVNIVAIPFKAWQQYTRQTRISRRDNKIAELNKQLDSITSTLLRQGEEIALLNQKVNYSDF